MTKGRAVILLLVLAGVLWILAAQSWGAAAQAPTGPAGVAEVAGEEEGGHPVLTACAAIIAVASLLLALLGRAGRIVVCVLIAAVGAGALLTGVSSSAPVHLVVLTAATGALIVAAAVWTAVVSRGWRVTSRYDRQATAADPEDDDPTTAWDALSRGEDPS